MSADSVRPSDMPADELTSTRKAGIAALLILFALYNFFVLQELFASVWVLSVGAILYLGWRFVRAFERIAAAMEDGD